MATPQTPEERAAAIWRAEMRLMERLKDLERREYSRSRKGTAAASSASVVSIPTTTARSPPEGATSSQTAACRVQDYCLTIDAADDDSIMRTECASAGLHPAAGHAAQDTALQMACQRQLAT